ncbi:MAG: hypothetical protein LJE74_01465 [Proteobacteria bacterium]|jgi:hypothetical protein|nr:hypothetical protein [Pseudomonadota bacterium]MCG6934485.1 hypothetical protein [Pseudomonadota bacterium]
MNPVKIASLVFVGLLLAMPLARAEDRMELEGTAIIGNQELPKMLYILPWKPSQLPGLSEPPLESMIDEALKPVERAEFQRQVIYYESLSQ